MKRNKTFTGWIGKGFISLVFACGLLLAALPAWSEVDCGALADPIGDFDNDGLLNEEECFGISLSDQTPVPKCEEPSSLFCLDPNKPDLFVILNRAPDSLIPVEDPFSLVTESNTGLNIVVHEIKSDQAPDRYLIIRDDFSRVRAAQITENLAPATDTDTKIGSAQQGMVIDKATVFTRRIADKVYAACLEADSDSVCQESTGITGFEALTELYIRHTIAHELGHIVRIAPEFNKRFDGYHWKAGSGFVMDQSIVYTSRKGAVTFYITQRYNLESKASAVFQ